MKNKITKIIATTILLSIFVFFVNSCRKNFELEEISNLTTDSLYLNGSFAAPLVKTELTLLNFLPASDSSLWAETDENDLVHLKMYYKDMYNPAMKEIYTEAVYPAPAGTVILADTLALHTDTSKMKVYDKILTGKLFFKNPSIIFHIDNYIPVVTFFKIDTLTFLKTDGTALRHISHTAYTIDAPVTSGSFVHTDIVIDTTEVPVLDSAFAPIPKFISFYLSSGSSTDQTLPCNVTGDERIKIDAEIDMPLEARLDTIVMSDTSSFSVFNDERIKSATLKIKFENGFPIDGISQIYFTDTTSTGEAGVVIDSVFTDDIPNVTEEGWHLESAETDPYGIVTTPKESRILIFIDQDRIQNLIQRHASKIIITGKLNTYNSTTGHFIKILGSYKMGVQIAVKLDYETSTNQF